MTANFPDTNGAGLIPLFDKVLYIPHILAQPVNEQLQWLNFFDK
jgi:hypothetical protein